MRTVDWKIIEGDCRDVLRAMPAQSVHTVVTSPPYFGLRDYGTGEWEGGDLACDHAHPKAGDIQRNQASSTLGGGRSTTGHAANGSGRACRCGARRVDRQIGLEPTPDEFVATMVAVFREVRRVLRDDGTVWLNLGDSYAGSYGNQGRKPERGTQRPINGEMLTPVLDGRYPSRGSGTGAIPPGADYKAKDLLGIPWMVAFALRADGWYLRSDIVWSKPNPMPESVTDRPTKSHEYVFLLSKGPRYAYDADAIREDNAESSVAREGIRRGGVKNIGGGDRNDGERLRDTVFEANGRNKRSVWTVATQPYAGAHFATFPPKLIEPCILAGAPERACKVCGAPWVRVVDRVLGSRTTDIVPSRLAIGHEPTPRPRSSHPPGWRAMEPDTLAARFEPSCSHGDGSARGVVLDPFTGAGTTGLVALQHGREFIGIELSPEYARMARERIETAVRLGFRAPTNGPEQIPGQMVLA